jgi:molecular chaperone HscB
MSSSSCWNCGAEVAPDALFCAGCEALQPPRPGRDYFEVLGMPRRFELEPEALEAAFKQLSRRLHPDRFATASPRERRLSLEHATALNDAYRTLRVPVKRAEYLLGLWGRPIGEEASRGTRLPMEFLEEVMELRERIAEAKFERDTEGVQRLLARVEQQWQDRYRDIEQRFAKLEAGSMSTDARTDRESESTGTAHRAEATSAPAGTALVSEAGSGEEARQVEALEQALHMLRYLQGILTEQGIVPSPAAPSR